MKVLTKGRVACAVLVAIVAGLGVASAAGASGTPWITHVPATGCKAPSTSSPTLSQGAFYIYNNLGAGDTYNSCIGWNVSEPGGGGSFTSAMSFTPSSSAQVTQIDVALSHISGTNNATIELARDDGGGIPGTVLGSWSVSGQPAFGTCCGLTTVYTGVIPVGAGRTYWVVAIAGPNGANDTDDRWNWNTTGATGGDFYAPPNWYMYGNPTGAFDVIGCGKICKVSP